MWLTSMLSKRGEFSLKNSSHGLVAADLLHHLLLVEAVGDEGLELVQADAQRVEVVVGVGRPVQAAHAAELVGTLLDLFVGDPHALLLGGAHRDAVPDKLLDESLELPCQLQGLQ